MELLIFFFWFSGFLTIFFFFKAISIENKDILLKTMPSPPSSQLISQNKLLFVPNPSMRMRTQKSLSNAGLPKKSANNTLNDMELALEQIKLFVNLILWLRSDESSPRDIWAPCT